MKGNSRVKTVLSLLVTSLALAPAASAQGPVTTAPAPQAATITAHVDSGLPYKGRPYVGKGESVKVTGTLKPYSAGQKVLVELLRKGHRLSQDTADVRSGGAFTARVRAKNDGALAIRVTHKATPELSKATTRLPLSAIVPSAHIGSHGVEGRLLQGGVSRLGFLSGHGPGRRRAH